MDSWIAFTIVFVATLTYHIEHAEGMDLCSFEEHVYGVKAELKKKTSTDAANITRSPGGDNITELRKRGSTDAVDVTRSPSLPLGDDITELRKRTSTATVDITRSSSLLLSDDITELRKRTSTVAVDITRSSSLLLSDDITELRKRASTVAVDMTRSSSLLVSDDITELRKRGSTDAVDVTRSPSSLLGDDITELRKRTSTASVDITRSSSLLLSDDITELRKRASTVDLDITRSSSLLLSDDITELRKRASTDSVDITRSSSLLLGDDMISKTSETNAVTSTEVSTTSYYEPDCPPNRVLTTCSCQITCADPNACYNNCTEDMACICPNGFSISGNDCINNTECGCFMEGTGVIPEGETYIDDDCSVNCSCNDNQLTCNVDYKCSSYATCKLKDNVQQCYCNDGYEGDGETCRKTFTDCYDAYAAGITQDGVYTILLSNWSLSSFNVSCDMTTSGGGWTVFQRRIDRVTDFYQPWDTYKEGFGSLEGDFWLGNEKLHYLTSQKDYTLRIDIVAHDGLTLYSEYSLFRIDNEDSYYQIVDIGSLSGNGGDGMTATVGRRFSTYDREEVCSEFSCPQKHRGAWWYASDWCNDDSFISYCALFRQPRTTSCTHANLNGDYAGGDAENIFWDIPGFSKECFLISAEMKLRPNY